MRELHHFVLARLGERIQVAEETGDDLERAFTLAIRKFVSDLEQDIADPALGTSRNRAYLLQTARRYRRHPDYNYAWDGPV